MKKYELVEPLKYNGLTVYHIKRVDTGEIGGMVESESNLSQSGSCWIDATSVVVGSAEVSGNARITDQSEISGKVKIGKNAFIKNCNIIGVGIVITDDARVEDCTINGAIHIYDKAYVRQSNLFDNVEISDNATINKCTLSDSVVVCKHGTCINAEIEGKTFVGGDAQIMNTREPIRQGKYKHGTIDPDDEDRRIEAEERQAEIERDAYNEV